MTWEPDDEPGSEGGAASDPFAQAILAARLGDVQIVESAEGGVGVGLVPRSVEEVARAVSIASRHRARVGLTRRPRPGLLALDLQALSHIDTPDEKSCLVRVGAGAAVRDVEQRAIQAGLTLGPLLPSSASKRVGAWLAGPTRGERAVPGGRVESAALALEAVLPDASFYRSREAPRSSTGPDLDALLLGAEGRFGVITRATLRLFPRALVEAAAARAAATPLEAIEHARRAVHDGLFPAEARWDRAHATLEARFTGSWAAQRARRFGSVGIGGREVRAHLEIAGSWKAWAAASPLRFLALQLVSLHTDGAFGALEFESAEEAERVAVHARAIGFAIVSPRRLRPSPATWWDGSTALFASLARQLDPHGVFAR